MVAQNEVVVMGAGPAGIAAAIATSLIGFRTSVLDARVPPLDKACGEGILPCGVTALETLGIHLSSDSAVPFTGIRFEDDNSSAAAEFTGGTGFALRRIKLHQLLVERALEVGVEFHWGGCVTHMASGLVTTTEMQIPYKWLIGADGQNSAVRSWAGLNAQASRKERFGFRKHLQVRPWTDMVEVYWAEGCQMYVTPTGEQEVGIAVFSHDPQFRIEQALPRFPSLAEKLDGATSTTGEMGSTTSLRILPAVTQGCIALAGDASGTVDAIAGQGLGVSFQQAIKLAEAIQQGNLELYELAHKKISAIPVATTRMLLLMERSDGLRRRALRIFQNSPKLFAKLLSIHSGNLPLSSIGIGELANFGWKLLRA